MCMSQQQKTTINVHLLKHYATDRMELYDILPLIHTLTMRNITKMPKFCVEEAHLHSHRNVK